MAKSKAEKQNTLSPGRARKLAEAVYRMRVQGISHTKIRDILAQGYPANPSNDPKHRWLWRPGAKPGFDTVEELILKGAPERLLEAPEDMRELQVARLDVLVELLQPKIRGTKVRRLRKDGTIVEVEPSPRSQLKAIKILLPIIRQQCALRGIGPAKKVPSWEQWKQRDDQIFSPELTEELEKLRPELERILAKYENQSQPERKNEPPQRPSSKLSNDDDESKFANLETILAADEEAGLAKSEREANQQAEPKSKG